MAGDNPYAPPALDLPPPSPSSGDDSQGLSRALASLSRWQRIAAFLFYALAGISLLTSIPGLLSSVHGDRGWHTTVSLQRTVGSVVMAGLLIAAAALIQSASTQIARAARTGAQPQLARGFRRVGGFLILHAVFSALMLGMVLITFWAFAS